MFFACQVYLESGILSVKQTESNKTKNIKLKYTEDLLFFFNAWAEKEEDFTKFRDVYNEFLQHYEITAKDYSKDRFSKGMNYIAGVLGYRYESIVKKIDGKSQQAIRISKKTSNNNKNETGKAA